MPKPVSSVRGEVSGLVDWIPVEFKLYLLLQFLWVTVKLICLYQVNFEHKSLFNGG